MWWYDMMMRKGEFSRHETVEPHPWSIGETISRQRSERKIVNVEDYGAFVKSTRREGLIHVRNQLSSAPHSRISKQEVNGSESGIIDKNDRKNSLVQSMTAVHGVRLKRNFCGQSRKSISQYHLVYLERLMKTDHFYTAI